MMLRRKRDLPLTPESEMLLLALVAVSCPLAQVDFRAEALAPTLGWEPAWAHRVFDRLTDAGYLTPLEETPSRMQIDARVMDWLWTRATEEIRGSEFPSAHQAAAEHLLLIRLHGRPH